ncbi:hypothetical protein [Allohahella sp. A8]|uniref:hypothetical protein n=1 Tax=Allohahella sp. A8 TaxID=3141461 RepID=UPI003A80DC4A
MARAEDIEIWQSVLDSLGIDQEYGMAFQDRMLKHFGQAVDARLEAMLDVWGSEVFYLESWDVTGQQVMFEIPAADDWHELVSDLQAVFALCPVNHLSVEITGEE